MHHSPPDATRPARASRFGLVVVSGAGEAGLGTALQLRSELPPLECPVLYSLRDVDADALHAQVDGGDVRMVEHHAPVGAARVWIAPSDRHTVVRAGQFELGESGVASLGQLPSLGMLYHSVRLEYGSRVLVVVTDAGRTDTPLLRLLSQRGAEVVSPLEMRATAGASTSGGLWTIARIVDHLAARAGAHAEVAA